VASRVLVVGSDADVSNALHLHLERAGYAIYCLPGPGDLEPMMQVASPHVLVLVLPASPDSSWGGALTTAAGAARAGTRIVMVGPSRDLVEPLAAVAGAEHAFSRAEVMARPLAVVERAVGPGLVGQVGQAGPPPVPARPPAPPPLPPPPAGPVALTESGSPQPVRGVPSPAIDLLALIDEELVDEPRARPQPTRVEVNVSLVSEHNFYVGATRRIDSGGVFVATSLPPPVRTRLQVRLGLADGRKVDVEGEVAFIREKGATTGRQPAGCGIRLTGLPGWASESIDRFIGARQPIVFTPR
jgi:hypothetical protein